MTCDTYKIPDGPTAIVCSRRKRTKPCTCDRPSTRLCDWKMNPTPMRRKLRSVTCDQPLCDNCTHSPAPDKDLCPTHAGEWKALCHQRRIVSCSSCPAKIVWVKTTSGKNMPVDADTVKPEDKVDELDLSRHRSHFADCPNSAQHRKPR